jgi:hypothetical protein
MTIHDHEVLTRAFPVTTCRDRVLQVLSFVDDEGPVVPEACAGWWMRPSAGRTMSCTTPLSTPWWRRTQQASTS